MTTIRCLQKDRKNPDGQNHVVKFVILVSTMLLEVWFVLSSKPAREHRLRSMWSLVSLESKYRTLF